MTDLSNPSGPTVDAPKLAAVNDLKSQAAQAAEAAKSSLNALAAEARGKVNDIVDHQKEAGADQLAGFAKAAQSAAGNLEGSNPAVARLVRDAASSVDSLAGSLRSSDVRDMMQSVSSFARQQPVAFFAGSVLIGFALARFLKSDAQAASAPRAFDAGSPGSGGGYRTWSSTHSDSPS